MKCSFTYCRHMAEVEVIVVSETEKTKPRVMCRDHLNRLQIKAAEHNMSVRFEVKELCRA
jgi:hypothetical protein